MLAPGQRSSPWTGERDISGTELGALPSSGNKSLDSGSEDVLLFTLSVQDLT